MSLKSGFVCPKGDLVVLGVSSHNRRPFLRRPPTVVTPGNAMSQRIPAYIDFVKLLSRSRLLSPRQLSELPTPIGTSAGSQQDTLDLIHCLLAERLITRWQLKRLLHEGGRRFFLGKYKLLGELGAGMTGTVYLAEQTNLHRRVALKVLPCTPLVTDRTDETEIERFRRECQVTAALTHNNIVHVFDFDTNGRCYYLAMEYVRGIDLHRLVAQRGPLPVAAAIDCVRQAARGLAYAHRYGLIHRDVKPANLLRDVSGTVKLVDLGVALLPPDVHNAPTVMENDRAMLGTVDYLAPEQALNSQAVGPASDIYGLGCTLYELLTGKPPFASGSKAERLLRHQFEDPPRLRTLRPDVPVELERICNRMLQKQPDERFHKCEDLIRALYRVPEPSASVTTMIEPGDLDFRIAA